MKLKRMRGFLLTITAGLVILSGCAATPPPARFQSDVPVSESRVKSVAEDGSTEPELRALNWDVPFYSQAPRGDWGAPYQEACEEASLLLAWYYATGQTPTLEEFEDDLLAMVKWEVAYFGTYEHTTLEQTAEMARVYLEYDAVEVILNPTASELRDVLNEGAVMVAPFAGRTLGNPYFTGAGPVYHNLVIRGYDGDRFITNDVGTRHGKNFTYDETVLMNALHDWHEDAATDPDGILKGEKKVLVVR